MSDRLTNLPDLGYEDEPPERINIALITFAFDNSELINLLKERGSAIKFENFNKMREINTKIDEVKSLNLEKFERPVSAFLTFENEEGLNRCTNYNETVQDDHDFIEYRTFLGEALDIQEASEPTDIIWENRHFTAFERFRRTMSVVGVVFLLLCGSFVVIFKCSSAATKPLLKYPSINCAEVIESQGKYLQERAFTEWDKNFDETGDSEVDDTQYTGILKCFCDKQALTPGFSKTQEY